MSNPNAITPFSCMPNGFPFTQNSPPKRMPSNSTKIFCPFADFGRRKCLRYHTIVSVCSRMLKRKASSSLKAAGRSMLFHALSFNVGSENIFPVLSESPICSSHWGLKLYLLLKLPLKPMEALAINNVLAKSKNVK
ncbi:MAG: hypothetical protein BWZ00_01848 [Bacteroidetes bacterium ADurb.BinA174]|nr:MAG: hypothetical protein BWZ00_01848 [Bacteroidetes bacterium ADurb.BinA174]